MAKVEHFERIKWKDRSERYEREGVPGRWLGIDTETCRGNVKLIADSDGRKLWDPTQEERLAFLYRPERRGAFFNLRYDVECILKGIPRDSMEALLSEGEATAYGYVFRYIPKKLFSIKPGDEWQTGNRRVKAAHHYDLAQFFNSSLDNAAKTYLGDSKKGLTKEQVRELGRDPAAWKKYPKKRIEGYCYHDAKLTAELAHLWDKWAPSMGLDFSHPISPAYVSGLYAEAQGWPYYSKALHETVGRAAWMAYAGGRFESRVKGYGTYYPADIRSAYPAEMENLPDPQVPWMRVKKESALGAFGTWGFVEADVKVARTMEWGPLPFHQSNGPIIYPVGNLGRKWMTLREYQTFREDPDIKMVFRSAYVAEDNGKRPLAWIAKLYDERLKLKQAKDPRQLVIKVVINSVYGKQMQKTPKEYRWRPVRSDDDIIKLALRGLMRYSEDGIPEVRDVRTWEMGNLFNPIWGAHVTAGTRLRLWDAIKRFDIAAVMTDGILSREPLPSGFGSAEPVLGTWDVEKGKQGVIVGNGLYQMEGEKPKRRGFGEPLAGFEWLTALRKRGGYCDICKRRACGVHIVIDDERPLHPGEIMRSKKWTTDDIGNFVPIQRRIDLNADEKRRFPKVTAKRLLSEQVLGKPLRL